MKTKIIGIGLTLLFFIFSWLGPASAESLPQAPDRNVMKQAMESAPSKQLPVDLDLSPFKKKSKNSSSVVKASYDEKVIYEAEPNDAPAYATPALLDYYLAGTIDYNDIDLYKITVRTAGDFAILGTAGDYPTMELMFGLFDSGMNILTPDGAIQDGSVTALGYSLQPGTYYIGAGDYLNLGTGEAYVLQSLMVPKEDTVPPAKPKVNPVSNKDKVVTGIAEKGSTVWVNYANKWQKSAVANSSGKFSISIPAQKEGTLMIVSAIDAAGNESEYNKFYVLDKTPPSTLTVNTVTTKTKTVTGKTEANANVEVKLGKKLLGKANADKKGNFKVNIKVQKKGSKLTVIASDKSKNAKSVSVTVK